VPAARKVAASGDRSIDRLGRSARDDVTITVRKPHDRIRVRDVNVLSHPRDPERILQPARERPDDASAAVRIAEDAHSIGLGFDDEEVTIRRNAPSSTSLDALGGGRASLGAGVAGSLRHERVSAARRMARFTHEP
jgi:hypothetical protein